MNYIVSQKIELDKYYTSKKIAEHCYNKALEVIGRENITEIIEPSAGAGVFIELDESIIGYDIAPEHEKIIKADFLTLPLDYKKGRLFLGNPPYGRCLNLAQKFYKKAVSLGDYVAFILPISQLNNNTSMYEFDLIYSEDLGKEDYSDRKLHCVFNIYKRNENGLNKKQDKSLQDITIIRQDSKSYAEASFDIRMCYWGNGSAGKILKEGETYSGEYKIKINNEERKEEIKQFIETFDWNSYINGIAMKRIKQYHIIDVLKANIQGIK